MNSVAAGAISQRISFPARKSGSRPNNRVYQSMLASRSATGTPAYRWVIALTSDSASKTAVYFPTKTAEGCRTYRSRWLSACKEASWSMRARRWLGRISIVLASPAVYRRSQPSRSIPSRRGASAARQPPVFGRPIRDECGRARGPAASTKHHRTVTNAIAGREVVAELKAIVRTRGTWSSAPVLALTTSARCVWRVRSAMRRSRADADADAGVA
jgi:hypothetical protein